MGPWVSSICAVLLLLYHDREGAALEITSTSKVNSLTGEDFKLDISLNTPKSATFFWTINGTTVASWKSGYSDVTDTYKNRLVIKSSGSLQLTKANISDSGNYSVTALVLGETLATRDFQVTFFDKGSVLDVSSTSTGKFSIGGNLSLVISYYSDINGSVTWTVNGSILATNSDPASVSSSYKGRLSIDGAGSLFITNMSQSDAGNYTIGVSVVDRTTGYRSFQVALNGCRRLRPVNAATLVGLGIGSILGVLLLLDNHSGAFNTKKKKL